MNVTWIGPETSIGQFSVSWFNTFVDEFKEIIPDPSSASGFQDRDLEGREDNDRGIPEWKSTFIVDYHYDAFSASWTLRHISDLEEDCMDFLDGSADSLANIGVCSSPDFANNSNSTNKLGSTTFNDVQVTYAPKAYENVVFSAGINNVFDKSPPACYSCSLNGYDPSTYDLPGQFGYITASINFGEQ